MKRLAPMSDQGEAFSANSFSLGSSADRLEIGPDFAGKGVHV
jgi:hypothetical protein